MIAMLQEQWFLLSDGPQKVGIARATLGDLIRRGRKSIGGVTVKLESFKTETGTATSVEAVARFRIALNDETQGE